MPIPKSELEKLQDVNDPKLAAKLMGDDRIEFPPGTSPEDFGVSSDPGSAAPVQTSVGNDVVNGGVDSVTNSKKKSDPLNLLNNNDDDSPQDSDNNADDDAGNDADNNADNHAELSPEQRLQDLEQKRRSWQSEAEHNKAEAEKLRHQMEEINQQNAMLRQMAMNQRAMETLITNNSQSAPQQTAPKQSAPSPEQFGIDNDELNYISVSDPRYKQYQDAVLDYKIQQSLTGFQQKITQQQQQERARQIAEKRARTLADRYPVVDLNGVQLILKDPLTGEPHYENIKNFLSSFDGGDSETAWVDLMEFRNWKNNQSTSASVQNNKGQRSIIDPNQVEKTKGLPTSVQQSSSGEITKNPLDDEIRKFGASIYEDELELPPDFGGFK